MNGEIIEQYPDDYPYPSCLILGVSIKIQVEPPERGRSLLD